jgi:hypothetical protein
VGNKLRANAGFEPRSRASLRLGPLRYAVPSYLSYLIKVCLGDECLVETRLCGLEVDVFHPLLIVDRGEIGSEMYAA